MQIKLLLLEKNMLSAKQASNFLTTIHNITLCGIATSYVTCLRLIHQYEPDVIFFEIEINQGQQLYFPTSIKKLFPHIHLVLYTKYDYLPFYNQLMEFNVSGMLHRSANSHDIISMLQAVIHGKTIVPLSIYKHMKLNRPNHTKRYWEFEFSPTEQKIIELVLQQSTNALIARKTHLSESSVEKYLRKIYDKLGVSNKAEALQRLEKERLIQAIPKLE